MTYADADGNPLSNNEPPTFHNTIEPVSASVTKEWDVSAAGSGAVVPRPAVTFRVIRQGETATETVTIGGKDYTNIPVAAPLDNSENPQRAEDITIASDPEGDDDEAARTATWDKILPKYDASGNEITYEVIEIGDIVGFEKGTITRVGDTGFIYTITNTLKPLSLTVTKLASNGETTSPLAGAGFTLTRVDPTSHEPLPAGDGNYYQVTLPTGSDGLVTFGGEATTSNPALYPGTYKLLESTVPPGYQQSVTEWIITINDDGTATLNGAGMTYDADARILSMEITNSELPPLPSTGGPSDMPLLVAGAVMVIAAMALLLRCGRRVSS